MTEKQKMMRQELYDANNDPELLAERLRAKKLCHTFNQLDPADVQQQTDILHELLGSIKGTCQILAPFWCDYGYNIEIGEDFFLNHQSVILDAARVSFGDHVYIGPNCGFYTAAHPLDAERRNQGLETARPISVGSHVWIGGGVQVLPGVNIGSDVVIGAGSVVTRDIPDHCIAAGNPCRVIRSLTDDEKSSEI